MGSQLSPDARQFIYLTVRYTVLNRQFRAAQQAVRALAQETPRDDEARAAIVHALHESIQECNKLVFAQLVVAQELDQSFTDARS